MQNVNEVTPTLPVAPYIGGKRNLAKTIIKRIDQIPHATYAEPFVGMGGVFLRRTRQPKAEVINDYSRDVTTFFRILQRHYAAFMEMMRFQITSRKEFERLVMTDPATLTDLERAARFLYLQRTAFGGKVSGKNFGVAVGYPGRFDINKLGPMLDDLHSRLSGVVIECMSYEQFIPKYDRQDTLFYLDPPYYGCESDYGKDVFHRNDFECLAEILGGIKGRFILSLNDLPEVRSIFSGFDIETVETTYTIAKGGSKKVGEVIISN
ncbi:DNA adenine methylase [Sneathiella sp.]|uniref:DNA adenine methylase n=1 Tax=Sneathiella sp. TaxID=1964365 RepID=UPI002FE2BF7C